MAGTRRQLARAGLIGLAGLAAAGMSACGSSGGAATSGASAASLLAAALHNAVTSRGVHELAQAHGAGLAVAMVNEIGPTSGRQVIDAAGGHSVVIVSGGRAYFRGDATALAGYYQFPVTVALEYAGKWISMGPKDSGYGRVSGAVTLASDFSQIAINGPLTARPVTLPGGQRAVAIAGTAKGPTGTEVPATLDVTAAGTILPIRLREGHGKVSEMVAWSRWGQPVAFAAPVGATPISGLGRTPGTGGPTQTPTRA
jgi:hypothetical protein